MDRRELLKMIAIVTGGAVIGGDFLLTGCKNPETGPSMIFSEENIAFLDEVAETILPQTSTAGAKAAGVGRFMTVMVNDCYTKQDQEIFHSGMVQLDDACGKMHGHGFMKATPDERKALLISIDKEVSDHKKKQDAKNRELEEKSKPPAKYTSGTEYPERLPNHYFQQMKQLAIFGYFTSQKGRTEALRFVPVPGKWEAVIDYKKGDKSFAGLS